MMVSKTILAAAVPVGPTLGGIGPLGSVGAGNDVANKFGNLLSLVIGFMGLVAVIWALFVIMGSGYAWMSAGGDAQKIQKARQQLTVALAGLLIAMAAVFLLAFVSNTLFHMNLLKLNEVVRELQFK